MPNLHKCISSNGDTSYQPEKMSLVYLRTYRILWLIFSWSSNISSH